MLWVCGESQQLGEDAVLILLDSGDHIQICRGHSCDQSVS